MCKGPEVDVLGELRNGKDPSVSGAEWMRRLRLWLKVKFSHWKHFVFYKHAEDPAPKRRVRKLISTFWWAYHVPRAPEVKKAKACCTPLHQGANTRMASSTIPGI